MEGRDTQAPTGMPEQDLKPKSTVGIGGLGLEWTPSMMQMEIQKLLRIVQNLESQNSKMQSEFGHHGHLDGKVVTAVVKY